MAKEIEDKAFALNAGQHTQPIRTKQGFIILQATQHQLGGDASFKQVEPQVEEALFMERMQPALREYLTKLREEAYVELKPGVVDTGASGNEMRLTYSAYTPPAPKKKKKFARARFRGRRGRPGAGYDADSRRSNAPAQRLLVQRPPGRHGSHCGRHGAPAPASRPRNRQATTTRKCRSPARKRRSASGRPRASLFLPRRSPRPTFPRVRTRIRVSPLRRRAT